ncbi:MAG: sulfatase-like hydrolase/transferase [Luteolibacter sp.]
MKKHLSLLLISLLAGKAPAFSSVADQPNVTFILADDQVSQEAFDNSFLMQLKQVGYSTAIVGKHHTKMVDRGNSPLRENFDFCYYGEGHLGFHPAKKHKVFSNLKNQSQTEGLFEAFHAYLKPGNDYAYFYENVDNSLKNQLEPRDPDKPFCAWINLNLPHQSSLGGMVSKPSDPEHSTVLKTYRSRCQELDAELSR